MGEKEPCVLVSESLNNVKRSISRMFGGPYSIHFEDDPQYLLPDIRIKPKAYKVKIARYQGGDSIDNDPVYGYTTMTYQSFESIPNAATVLAELLLDCRDWVNHSKHELIDMTSEAIYELMAKDCPRWYTFLDGRNGCNRIIQKIRTVHEAMELTMADISPLLISRATYKDIDIPITGME
jgi:hypothetical protein